MANEAPVTQSAVVALWQFISAHPYLLLFVLLFVRPLYKRYSSPLRQFPGPFLASCTRLWNGGPLNIAQKQSGRGLTVSFCSLERLDGQE